MDIEQRHWLPAARWPPAAAPAPLAQPAQLLFAFGGTGLLDPARFQRLRELYPEALIVGCSTAGEIHGTAVHDDTLAMTAIRFSKTRLRLATARVAAPAQSRAAGAALARQLPAEDLVHVLLISDGLKVNGTDLVDGLKSALPERVAVTGGLSGDGARFQRTLVMADAAPAEGVIAAVGFYGENLRVGYGSLGGWDPFGPDRRITRASGNVLYELDGESALSLYKRYLGEHAAGLPAAGLLFPLALRAAPGSGSATSGLVRTILAVDEAEQSMTFAGDMPVGMYARLMKANFDRLVAGASGAAQASQETLGAVTPQLALLISCVGRKLVLQQRIEEEVESVREVLGAAAVLTGFYSYGEISPYAPTAKCELHNQTMTITTFAET
ncbi:MAG TPA: FIST N-terminal domain-containing protein [Rhodocyclaceae bacterium]|nr:FIST N-terminal domain-containing protein [Rhodocyclaceae bacterium]